jgi:hypothetical protein
MEWEEGIELNLFDLEEETKNYHQCLFMCNILSSQVHDGDRYFEVVLFEYSNLQFSAYTKGEACHIPGHIFVVGMPSEAITLIDLPYTSDEHIEGAFRHEIGVPDELFPPNWLDIPKEAK